MRRFLKCLPAWRSIMLLACGLAPATGGLALESAGNSPTEVPALSSPAAMPLTIDQAIGLALTKNPGLQQAANQVDSGAIDVAQRKTDFAPDLDMTLAGAERFDKGFELGSASRDNRNYETVSGALTSRLNLFNGFGDIAALRGAEWELSGLQESFTREEQTLVFSTISAFLQALSDRELIRVRAENLWGNRRQLEQVEALYQAGNRPVSDLYQQQAETSNAELELLIAERNFAVALLQLRQIVGVPPTTAVEPRVNDLGELEATLVARPQMTPDLTMLAQRADLRARAKQIEANREQVVQAQAGYWPTLDLAASLDADYSGLDRAGFSEQFFNDNAGGAIGLTLSIPIFDRQQTRNLVAKARLRQEDAHWSLVQRQLQAEAEVGQAFQDFRTAQQLIGVVERRLTAARQALATIEERYRVGAATLVELTQVRAQFVEADYERVKARYGLITQGVAAAYYQGDWEQMRSLLALWENRQ